MSPKLSTSGKAWVQDKQDQQDEQDKQDQSTCEKKKYITAWKQRKYTNNIDIKIHV